MNKKKSRSKRTSSNITKATREKWRKGKKGSFTSDTIKPNPGFNYYKLAMPDFEKTREHWITNGAGVTRRFNCFADPDDESPEQTCIMCEAEKDGTEMNTNIRYYFAVLVGRKVKRDKKSIFKFKAKPVKVLEVGQMIGRKLCQLGEEIDDDVDGEWAEDNVNDISDVVIGIERTGQGMKKTRYETSIPRHWDTSKTVMVGEVDSSEVPLLADFVKKPNKKTVAEFLAAEEVEEYDEEPDEDEEFEDEETDEEWEEEKEGDEDEDEEEEEKPKRKKKKSSPPKSKKKKKSKPEPEDEDEDEELEDEDEEDFEEDEDEDWEDEE